MTVPLLVRDRLMDRLGRRHELDLTVLVSPPGFGRTTLLEQALADPSSAQDAFHRCTAGDGAELVSRVAAAAGVTADDAPGLAEALADRQPTALVLDEVEALGPVGLAALTDLVRQCGPRFHLVLSGRRVPTLDLPRRLAAGTADRLVATDLAFTTDEITALMAAWNASPGIDREPLSWPALATLLLSGHDDTVTDYLRDPVLAAVSEPVVRALAAVAVTGGPMRGCRAAAAALGPDVLEAVDEAIRLPLVAAGSSAAWPHRVWVEATTGLLSERERQQVVAAAGRAHREAGDLVLAGELVLRSGDPTAIVDVVGAALSSQPPLVPADTLQGWLDRLPTTSADDAALEDHRLWLQGVVDAGRSDRSDTAGAVLEQARGRFEAKDDATAECAVLLHLGTFARRRHDTATIIRLMGRAQRLGRRHPQAAALAAMGSAVAAQMAGDNAAALAALDEGPVHALSGDWAAQARMVRGTLLALGGQVEASVLDLQAATGAGSGWSRAVAWDLLGSVLWGASRIEESLSAADEAVRLAEAHAAPTTLEVARSARLCMWVVIGDPRASDELAQLSTPPLGSAEATSLVAIARTLDAAARGDLPAARNALAQVVTHRAVRSTLWATALATALDGAPEVEVPEVPAADGHGEGPVEQARRAGRAGARFLHDGTPAPPEAQPYLPAAWCDPMAHPIALRMVGRAEVWRGGHLVDHPMWGRARVRELALRLAADRGGGRSRVAADLWPDLLAGAAAGNLRVTLSHLLDVIDPGRTKGGSSGVLDEGPGRLRLADTVGVDLRDLRRHGERVTTEARRGDTSAALGAARRLLLVPVGPLLSGDPIGEWAGTIERDLDELVGRAAIAASHLALDLGDGELAEALALRALTVDRWSEDAHRMLVTARLLLDDRDGARWAVSAMVAALDELGIELSPAAVGLVQRVRRGDPWRAR